MEPTAELETVVKILQEFIDKLGVPRNHSNEINTTTLEKYFEFTTEDLSKLSAEQCCEISVLLTRESFFLQREYSKMNAKRVWAEEKLRYSLADKLSQYGQYVPHTQKEICAIKESEYATELHKIIVQLKVRLTSLEYLASSLNKHAESFTELGKTKRAQK